MTQQRRITTAVSLRRREAAARRVQDAGPGSCGEVARLEAWVAELVAKNRQLEIANAGLRRRLDDIEDEADE
jgi:hypothetical protein